jgi:hypothetical protein
MDVCFFQHDNTFVYFSVTVSTQYYTFVDFFQHNFPLARPHTSDATFFIIIRVVKV